MPQVADKPRARTKDTSVIPRKLRGVSKSPAQKAKDAKVLTGSHPVGTRSTFTDKQKIFIREWAGGETILSAAYRAGYKDNGGFCYGFSKRPDVMALYAKEKALYAEAAQITRKDVMDGFLEAAQMARTLADPTALVSAFRELGRMAGFYEPTKRSIDITVSGNVTKKRLEAMSDADLLKLVKGEVEDVAFQEIEHADNEAEDE